MTVHRDTLIDSLTFWAVTSATATSEIDDCVFEATPRRLVLQGLGGLLDRAPMAGPDDRPYLVAVYATKGEAVAHAERLIAAAQSATVEA